ncbi:MAG: hypothetical protein ACKO13_02455, partial [Cytophagales bacterium]
VRKFGKDYSKRIKQAGLLAEPSTFASHLTEEKAKYFGLERREVFYLGKKCKTISSCRLQ